MNAESVTVPLALDRVGAGPAQRPLAPTSVSRAYQLRLSLLCLAGLAACALCWAIGTLIASAAFGTSPGPLT